jgi:hypothetical protein
MKVLVLCAKIGLVVYLVGGSLVGHAQQFYRLRADVSIKEKLANGTTRLSVGTAYYDKLYGKIVYKFTFPQPETIIIQDTSVYRLDQKGKLLEVQKSIILPEFTIFHLALTNRLSDYGMKSPDTGGYELYKMAKVEKQNNKVISTWMPNDPSLNQYLGKLLMSNVNKRLEAIAMYGPDGGLLSRQFFKEYKNIKGVEYPTKVTQLTYSTKSTGGNTLQQTTYSNILIDQTDEDAIYRHPIPLSQLPALRKKQSASSPK